MAVRAANDTKDFTEVLMKQDHVYRALGMGALDHNVLCNVCHENSAVWNLGGPNHNILEPCWDCQRAGYRTVKLTKFMKWWIG